MLIISIHMSTISIRWSKIEVFSSRTFKCGYCGADIASEKGFFGQSDNNVNVFIRICHKCSRPTFIDFDGLQYPGVAFGEDVSDIPDKSVETLYDEARRCIGVSAFTSAVLACRKLLMHIAVAKGADEGKAFIHYVDYLASNNYVPPDAREWVDHIRAKGNEANHEITIISREDAEELISFCEMLLKMIYEFPAAVKRRINKP